jgi:hypothetical protein
MVTGVATLTRTQEFARSMHIEFWDINTGYMHVANPGAAYCRQVIRDIGRRTEHVVLLLNNGAILLVMVDSQHLRYVVQYLNRGEVGRFRVKHSAVDPAEVTADLPLEGVMFTYSSGKRLLIPPHQTLPRELAIKVADSILTHQFPPDWVDWKVSDE